MSTTRSRRARRVLAAGGALLVCLPLALSGPAYAAPPPNDDITGATRISQEPASHRFDSTEATREAGRLPCVGSRSVWFRFRATDTERLRLTTAGSSFDTVLALFSGPRRSPTLIDCDDDARFDTTSSLRQQVRQGGRYWIAVSSFGGGPGGEGVLTVGDPVPPSVEVTIEEARAGRASGRLVVVGEMTCASPNSFSVAVLVSQRVSSGGVARGTGFGDAPCDADTRTWEAVLDSETGWAFEDGPLAVDVVAQSWNGFARARTEESEILTASSDSNARPGR
ncbi:hypothetical protein [Nocardioides coralli]|uniref:hypothetical protein n=1 Tax=Nocardioides coralli TaxID=2872154 RepID=UPI001CA44966|nr:hypothetical protein [Nocardioides coralli]QZY28825.1 hypothetical protein K6T13_15440 [Nocardioides coralli]